MQLSAGRAHVLISALAQDVPQEWVPYLTCVHAARISPALCSMLARPQSSEASLLTRM